jgi:hypothetical protein
MKKYFMGIITCMILLSVLVFAAAENSELPTSGTWYSSLSGIPIRLTLSEDGSYTSAVPGTDPVTGTWEERNGDLFLDGSETPEFTVQDDRLLWNGMAAFLTREEQVVYTPAETFADFDPALFRGYWKALYVDVDGTACLASALNDTTDLYVEGNSMILGGPLFGDLPVKAESTDGALACTAEGITVTLRMQQDSFLRMTVDTGEETLTWYLEAAGIPEAE